MWVIGLDCQNFSTRYHRRPAPILPRPASLTVTATFSVHSAHAADDAHAADAVRNMPAAPLPNHCSGVTAQAPYCCAASLSTPSVAATATGALLSVGGDVMDGLREGMADAG